MSKEESGSNALPYPAYLRERKSLIDSEMEMAKSFDKFILTLSGGAFGLSFTFINQIVPVIDHGTIWMLPVAWSGFVLSILSTLISMLTSQEGCSRQRDILDDLYKNGKNDPEPKNLASLCTRWLNIFSMIFFILGAIFLIIFSSINISKGGCKMSNNNKDVIQKGGFVAQKTPKTVRLNEAFAAQKLPVVPIKAKEVAPAQKIEKGVVPQKPPQAPNPAEKK